LQRWGISRRAYFDNGAVYRSDHVRKIVAILGVPKAPIACKVVELKARRSS